jgi:hypothetical protein
MLVKTRNTKEKRAPNTRPRDEELMRRIDAFGVLLPGTLIVMDAAVAGHRKGCQPHESRFSGQAVYRVESRTDKDVTLQKLRCAEMTVRHNDETLFFATTAHPLTAPLSSEPLTITRNVFVRFYDGPVLAGAEYRHKLDVPI